MNSTLHVRDEISCIVLSSSIYNCRKKDIAISFFSNTVQPYCTFPTYITDPCFSFSPSCPNLHLGERARCHADSGTQRCQGLAAAPNMIMVRSPCQPKRSSGILVHFIIFLLHDTSESAARRRWWRWWVGATCHGTVRHSVRCFCSDCPNQPQTLPSAHA